MEEKQEYSQPAQQEYVPAADTEALPAVPVQPEQAQPVQPRPRWTPPPQPPAPVFETGKREVIFGAVLLVCSVLMWNFIVAGGFNLGFAIGAVCMIGCSVGYLLSGGCRPDWYSVSLLVLSAVIAAGFGRSADGFVKYVLMHFLLLAVNLALCLTAGKNRHAPGGVKSLMDAPRTLFGRGFGGMGAAGRGLKEARKHAGSFGTKATSVIVGLVVAVPVVALMIVLLMQADAAFEGMLDLLPEADWNEWLLALLLGGSWGWLLYSRNVSLRRGEAPKPKERRFRGFSPLTIHTVLIAVCLVYVAYLVSQLAYLSGGLSGILPEDYTMAEYARRGFFEMAWLCAINLTIIACGVGLLEKREKTPLLTRLLCLFIGLITVFLVATASAKMFMYIGGYGLTRLRVLTEVIMIWLGLATALVCLWLFLPKMPYMKGVLLLAMLFGAGVLWADVDTQVARYNVRAYQSGALETIDVEHLTWLGPGAIPYIMELTGDDDPEVAEQAQKYLDFASCDTEDFRDWNLAEAQGAAVLEAMRAEESREAAAHLTEQLGVNVPEAEVVKRRSLDGLEENGQTYLAVRLTEEQAEAFLAELEKAAEQKTAWHKLPVLGPINHVISGEKAAYPRFLSNSSHSILPELEEGYLFFLDLHDRAEDPYDLQAFTGRKDYRFCLAIYDPAERMLYFVTMDS